MLSLLNKRAVYSPVAVVPVLALRFARLVHDDHVVGAVNVLDRLHGQVRLRHSILTTR